MEMKREENGKHYSIFAFYPSQHVRAHTHTHTHTHLYLQILFSYFSYISGKSYCIYCSVYCFIYSTIYHGHFLYPHMHLLLKKNYTQFIVFYALISMDVLYIPCIDEYICTLYTTISLLVFGNF